jgi:hypothetical protein
VIQCFRGHFPCRCIGGHFSAALGLPASDSYQSLKKRSRCSNHGIKSNGLIIDWVIGEILDAAHAKGKTKVVDFTSNSKHTTRAGAFTLASMWRTLFTLQCLRLSGSLWQCPRAKSLSRQIYCSARLSYVNQGIVRMSIYDYMSFNCGGTHGSTKAGSAAIHHRLPFSLIVTTKSDSSAVLSKWIHRR